MPRKHRVSTNKSDRAGLRDSMIAKLTRPPVFSTKADRSALSDQVLADLSVYVPFDMTPQDRARLADQVLADLQIYQPPPTTTALAPNRTLSPSLTLAPRR